MPDGDGPSLYAWIEREKPHLAARTAFITGDTLGDAAATFLRRSGRPVVEKPFSGTNVRALLAALASRGAAREA
jgi:two-component system NtrC family sensor kinase